MLTIYLALVSLFFYILTRYVKSDNLHANVDLKLWREYWKKLGFCSVDKVITYDELISGERSMMENDIENYTKLKQEGVCGSYEFGMKTVHIYDLDLLKHILIKDFDCFFTKKTFSTEPYFDKMLLSMSGNEWKDLRNLLSPFFSTGKIKKMFENFNAISQNVIDNILRKGQESELDMKEYLLQYSFQVLFSTLYSEDIEDFDQNLCFSIAKRFHSPKFRIIKLFLTSNFARICKFLGISLFDKAASNFFVNLTKSIIKKRAAGNLSRNDFLQVLIDKKKSGEEEEKIFNNNNGENCESRKKDNLIMTENMIIANCLMCFFAGFDNVEVALNLCLYHLAIDPDLQEKMYLSLKEAVDKSENGQLNYDIVNEDNLLERFFLESQRLYPIAMRLERVSSKDFKVPFTDKIIPNNTAIIYPLWAVQHDPEIFPNPYLFDPDRFLPENKASRHPSTFSTFGQGPRICLAKRFATIEMKTFLANFILNCKSETTENTPKSLNIKMENLLITPAEKILIRVKKRI